MTKIIDDRGADRRLDEEIVAGVVGDQFPELAGDHVERLGRGWDNEVFVVGDVIFRFPKRVGQVAWQRREIVVVRLVGQALGSIVPSFAYVGRPSERFAYPFVGYPKLPGIPAGRPGVPLGPFAADMASALAALHAIDSSLIPPTPAAEESAVAGGHRLDLSSCADQVRRQLRPDLVAVAEPYLTGQAPCPSFDGPGRLAHNDICAEHVLGDPGTGRLHGLIDWTDAMVTDPAVDFVGLITIGGWPFIGDVLNRYPHRLDSSFDARLQWMVRTLALRWLGDAIEEGDSLLGRQLACVDRAFEQRR